MEELHEKGLQSDTDEDRWDGIKRDFCKGLSFAFVAWHSDSCLRLLGQKGLMEKIKRALL